MAASCNSDVLSSNLNIFRRRLSSSAKRSICRAIPCRRAPGSTYIRRKSIASGEARFQADGADQFIALDRYPKTAIVRLVISGDSVNLLSQCTLDVRFKGRGG